MNIISEELENIGVVRIQSIYGYTGVYIITYKSTICIYCTLYAYNIYKYYMPVFSGSIVYESLFH